MYIETAQDATVMTRERFEEEKLIALRVDTLPTGIEHSINSDNNTTKEPAMKSNKEYTTYHSENNCRDWMLMD
ncbi:MAG: hypothetical protein K9N46_00115 [Candidatus Marinimicrobia bacterium]|nr:hypothetical protein [Candidatus Neomarinimicrobiota bacterium]MCF7829914.1 hypothetical protein [Candidatus Neomarinimicrobiota bacterium]MCF7879123.1 hypothetical protein [Candidatus Neomarinimicrobiota bacterium]